MRNVVLLAALLLVTAEAGAQNKLYDSLRAAIAQARSDTLRLRMLDSLAASNYVWSYPDSALAYANKELKIARKLGSDREAAYALNQRSWSYIVLGRYIEGLSDALATETIAADLPDRFPDAMNEVNYSEIDRDMGDYRGALEHAFALRDKTAKAMPGNPDYGSLAQVVIGMAYGKLGRWDSALVYINRSYVMRVQAHLPHRGIVTSELANVYSNRGEAQRALTYYHEAVAETKAEDIPKDLITTYNGMSRTFLRMGQVDSAIYYARLTLGLGRHTLYRLGKIEAAHTLAMAFQRAGRTDSAWKYLDIYIAENDSSFSAQQLAAITSLTYNTRLQRQEMAAAVRQHWSNLRFFGLLCLLVAILFITVILIRNVSLRRKNDRLRFEQLNAGLRQQAQELEMQVLRSQMNPHFIFNCLNAINRFILMSEPQTASDYLTKFSRLVRMVLNHSRKESIPLEEELVMLGLYLDLERLRFKESFDYSIEVDLALDPANAAIPPLLLQPFVENAIWHGLMHRREQGRLLVGLRPSGGFLCCEIEDNGIGRARAAELKSKSAELKKSMGIEITRTRLALFNKNAGRDHSGIEIHDLRDANGQAAGTRVTLMISQEQPAEDASLRPSPESLLRQSRSFPPSSNITTLSP